MQIYIQVKQLGKRKASIEAQKFIIEDSLFTVHDLLYDINQAKPTHSNQISKISTWVDLLYAETDKRRIKC